jgi:hypothetical protein
MSPILKQLTDIGAVIGWSATKFLIGVAHSTVIFNMGFLPSVLLTVGGGMIGVFIFAFFDKKVRWWYHHWRGDDKTIKKIKFTKNKRRMVKFRDRFGLAGIAFLTPVLFSVPIGTFMALRFTHNMYKISLYMFLSFLFFSLFFCGLFYGFHAFFMRTFGDILHP